ncbi:hypothetical protein QA648_30980 (plasmid) [Rhizobium sp. CB3171]|uniref:hypothetical protein n=1 Tax=unclassified Rhizobium TaxID=2613769 RepID=UPI0021A87F07|nr:MULTISPECIES: hypothetical protein [Rhizobium]UWU24225.1 hypothetical protein N2601_28810 [Rhizobium tropici]WFU05153.1 hypothetical protein QA648_30980 [Rhizobium sp. CB3171]
MTGLNFWAVGLSLGILSFQWPVTLIFLLAFLIFLSLWKGFDENAVGRSAIDGFKTHGMGP